MAAWQMLWGLGWNMVLWWGCGAREGLGWLGTAVLAWESELWVFGQGCDGVMQCIVGCGF